MFSILIRVSKANSMVINTAPFNANFDVANDSLLLLNKAEVDSKNMIAAIPKMYVPMFNPEIAVKTQKKAKNIFIEE